MVVRCLGRTPLVVSLQNLDGDAAAKRKLKQKGMTVGMSMFSKMLKVSYNVEDQFYQGMRSVGEVQEAEGHGFGMLGGNAAMDGCGSDAEELQMARDSMRRTPMDSLLLDLWDLCSDAGRFRYDVSMCCSKVLPGACGFVVQLNEGRTSKKRATEIHGNQMVQHFDGKKFNFNKVPMKEALFQFTTAEAPGETIVLTEEAVLSKSPNIVLINIFPIEYGHILLAPSVWDNLPQLITFKAMLLALHFAAAVDNPYFRIGYNSLCGNATVNHLHFQGYYLMDPYPVEQALCDELDGDKWWNEDRVQVSVLKDYPVRGLVFKKIGTWKDLASVLTRICTKMQMSNTGFNILISDCGARVFLWPQCWTKKAELNRIPQSILAMGVVPGVFEIAGHIILNSRANYNDITEEKAWELLNEASLSEKGFQDFLNKCLG